MNFPGAGGKNFAVHMRRPYIYFRSEAAKKLSNVDPARAPEMVLCSRTNFEEENQTKIAGKLIKKKTQNLVMGGVAFEQRQAEQASGTMPKAEEAAPCHDDILLDISPTVMTKQTRHLLK